MKKTYRENRLTGDHIEDNKKPKDIYNSSAEFKIWKRTRKKSRAGDGSVVKSTCYPCK